MYRSVVERALEKVKPEDWGTSYVVSEALLRCPRVKSMAQQAMRRLQVRDYFEQEVISEAALIVQMRCISGGLSEDDREKGKLQKISDIYFIIYQTIENVCRNYRKKVTNTNFSMEKNFSALEFEDETDEDLIGKYSTEHSVDAFDQIERKLDLELAQKRLKAKLDTNGWPTLISKERSAGRGRPTLAEKKISVKDS
jgi:hypothetical protein